jgi:hypothetical protein
VELKLASVRHKLPALWDRAAAALAGGQDHLTGLALRRRQVLLRELDNLSQLIASKAPRSRLLSRIEAADRLLDASLSEASRTSQPQPREPVILDLDPAVQSDLQRLRAQMRNETGRGVVHEEKEGER